jgi:hypothetical protein
MNTPCAICSSSITSPRDAHVFHVRGRYRTIVCARCSPFVQRAITGLGELTRGALKKLVQKHMPKELALVGKAVAYLRGGDS